MKYIKILTTLTVAEDMPKDAPFSKEEFENIIEELFKSESSEKEFTDVKSIVIDYYGVNFKNNPPTQ